MKELIGKKIESIFIDGKEQELIKFNTDQGPVVYDTYGDCCSETWFADITGIDALIGHTVMEVEKVDMGEVDDGRTRQEVDEVYSVKFKTTGGHADIVYRNSSNGYYGGDCSLTSKEIADADLLQVTEDYSA